MSKWEAQPCFSTMPAQAEIVAEFKQNLFIFSELPVETFANWEAFT